jgi:gentisate 1,2-dioxygenase
VSQTNGVDAVRLFEKFSAQKVEPLWTVMHSMVKPRPSPRAEVCFWEYKDLRPLLVQAGDYVRSEDAERRVLMLVNPALSVFFPNPKLANGTNVL